MLLVRGGPAIQREAAGMQSAAAHFRRSRPNYGNSQAQPPPQLAVNSMETDEIERGTHPYGASETSRFLPLGPAGGIGSAAPIGALVYGFVRLNHSRTIVYEFLCGPESIDTSCLEDKLGKCQKGFDSERFDRFCPPCAERANEAVPRARRSRLTAIESRLFAGTQSRERIGSEVVAAVMPAIMGARGDTRDRSLRGSTGPEPGIRTTRRDDSQTRREERMGAMRGLPVASAQPNRIPQLASQSLSSKPSRGWGPLPNTAGTLANSSSCAGAPAAVGYRPPGLGHGRISLLHSDVPSSKAASPANASVAAYTPVPRPLRRRGPALLRQGRGRSGRGGISGLEVFNSAATRRGASRVSARGCPEAAHPLQYSTGEGSVDCSPPQFLAGRRNEETAQ